MSGATRTSFESGAKWTIPDDLRRYIIFNATIDPRCCYAEALCIKYHTFAIFNYVLVSEFTEDLSIVGSRMLEGLWDQLVEDVELPHVSPLTVRVFVEDLIRRTSYSDPRNLRIARLDEVLPKEAVAQDAIRVIEEEGEAS